MAAAQTGNNTISAHMGQLETKFQRIHPYFRCRPVQRCCCQHEIALGLYRKYIWPPSTPEVKAVLTTVNEISEEHTVSDGWVHAPLM